MMKNDPWKDIDSGEIRGMTQKQQKAFAKRESARILQENRDQMSNDYAKAGQIFDA